MQKHNQAGAGPAPTTDARRQRGLSGTADAVASRFHGIAKPRPERKTLLIRDATVLVDAGTVIDADIHVRDGVIVEVGSALHVEGGDLIDGSGFVVMPGLVDTHWHMWTSLMRNMAANSPCCGYFPLTTKIGNAYTPEDMYLGNLLSAAEAIEAGITTVHDWCHNIRTREHAVAGVRALSDSNLRGRFSYGPARSTRPTDDMSVEDFIEMHENWHGISNEGMLHLGLGWRGVQSIQKRTDGSMGAAPTDPALYRSIYDAAVSRRIPVTLHANSTQADAGHVAALHRLGLLHEGFQLVHCTCVTPDEIEAIRESGAVVTLSPYSAMIIGYGVPPVRALGQAGVSVTLSADSTPLTGRADLLELAKVAHNLYNSQALSEFACNASDVLSAVTSRAARSLGLGDVTGSVEAGKRADLIMISKAALRLCPLTDIPHALVHSASVGDVDTVIVDGRVLKRSGRLTAIDTEKLRSAATEASKAVRARAEGAGA